MSRYTISQPLDDEKVNLFGLGLDVLFLQEEDPGIGSARVAKARLLDLGEELRFDEDLVEMIIDTAREGRCAVVTPGLLDTLAVLHDLGHIDVVGRAWAQLEAAGLV